MDEIIIRPGSEADLAAILELRRRCFATEDEEKIDPQFWRWEFRAEYRSAAITVAERGGRVLSHFAVLPMQYRLGDALVDGGLGVDAMTDPEARGAGLYTSVVSRGSEDSGVPILTAFQIRTTVRGAMERAGWHARQSMPVFVRPASLLSVVASRGSRTNASEESARQGAQLLNGADAGEMAKLARDAFPSSSIRLERSEAFLTWRLFSNPRWQYRVFGLRENGELVAWAATRRTTLKGFDTLAIVDFVCAQGGARGGALLKALVQEAGSAGVQLVAALLSWSHPALKTFLFRGFVPGPHRFRLLTRLDPILASTLDRRPWIITWIDTDHL
jgi:hypothetical protein